ncbi:MAG: sulfatase-like hydrolase/transferase, partial [Rhodothermales bacterium]|nr:sulfatase-like hydrolase/transferase [Rhodothermales bacterium]
MLSTASALRIVLSLTIGLAACRVDAPPSRPNVVLILADDLGYGDPGAYNEMSRIPTPSIDRLAAEGMRFTDAHTPSAVCTPTRYGLLTGRYAWRTHLKSWVLGGYSPGLIDTTRMTVASLFQQSGYATGAIGKWHLGLGDADPTDFGERLRPGPNALGFDYFFGIPASLDFEPYVYVENEWVVAQPTDTIGASRMRREGGQGFWRAGRIAPVELVEVDVGDVELLDHAAGHHDVAAGTEAE